MRLLVIEDNLALVSNLFEYFEARGYAMDAAPDGVSGLRLAATRRYDAVILDWMLPKDPRCALACGQRISVPRS
jgi:DNA-binding response OmpR family regulator